MAQFKEFKQIIVTEENRETVYEILAAILTVEQVNTIISTFKEREAKYNDEQLVIEFPSTMHIRI